MALEDILKWCHVLYVEINVQASQSIINFPLTNWSIFSGKKKKKLIHFQKSHLFFSAKLAFFLNRSTSAVTDSLS